MARAPVTTTPSPSKPPMTRPRTVMSSPANRRPSATVPAPSITTTWVPSNPAGAAVVDAVQPVWVVPSMVVAAVTDGSPVVGLMVHTPPL